MKKAITKVTAALTLTAFIAMSCPSVTALASSVLPAAGIAVTTGIGSSIKDIKADIARAQIKNESAKSHKKVTVNQEIALSSADGVVSDVTVIDASVEPENKVPTPASIAVSKANEETEKEVEKTATIEVTNNETVLDDGAVKVNTTASQKASEAMAENGTPEKTTVEVSSDVITPDIEIAPEQVEVGEGEEDLSRTVIAQVDGYVNVRESADGNSEVVGKLYNHSAGEWLGKEGDWYKISSGNVVGYVKGEYVVTGQAAVKLAAEVGIRTATVHTETLRVREEANLDSPILGLIPNEDQLTVLAEEGDWVKVSIEEGDGWISKEFVSITTEFPKAESKAEEKARLAKEAAARSKANAAAKKAAAKNGGKGVPTGGSYKAAGTGPGAGVANYGLQFVGNPYVFGGTSLTNGTDCSGFTMGVYRNFGVSLPHSSSAQRSCGYAVGSLSEAMPGDIICYSGHVAIYIGGGQIVHASTAKTGIKVSNAAYRPIVAIRRIF